MVSPKIYIGVDADKGYCTDIHPKIISRYVLLCISMRDLFGREVKSLRISVTQRCNLSCFYCHNEGQQKSNRELSVEEIERIVRCASELGIKKIKITGGEPLLRDDIVEIVARVSRHLEEVSMTTNGIFLRSRVNRLKEAGLARVNVSLDTLNPRLYQKITGNDFLREAVDGIRAAAASGLGLKINQVVLRGLNVDEFDRMVGFSYQNNAVLQLIELETNKKDLNSEIYKSYHYDLKPLEKMLEQKAVGIEKRALQNRKKYFIPYDGGTACIEVVRPMHNSEFCRNCSRLRLTSDGKLKPCLLTNEGLVNVAKLIREKKSDEWIKKAFIDVIRQRKPYWR